MDYVTPACQLLGGVFGALLSGALFGRLSLGALGNTIVGCVGGPLGGLILTGYLTLAPAGLPDGSIAELPAALSQVASGAAGGVVLVFLVGLLKGLVRD